MKKVFAILAIAGFLAACNNDSEKKETKDSTAVMMDTTHRMMDTTSHMDTTHPMMDTTKPKM
jgi:hypothetical protein